MSGPAFEINGQVFFQPHAGKQQEVLRVLTDRVRFGVGPSKWFLRSMRGTGKSVLLRKGLAHALAMVLPGLRYGVIRRNMPDLRQNHLIYLGAEMRTLGGDFHETHGIAHYENGSMGFYRQCEDGADVEKIVGAELGLVIVDEAPQIAWEFLRTISPSVRVAKRPDGTFPHYALEVYSGNPIGESIEELDRYCVDRDVTLLEDPEYRAADWGHVILKRSDNPSIDEDEYRKQFAGLPAHYRAAWLDGERIEDRTLFDVFPRVTKTLLTSHLEQKRDQPLEPEREGQPYHYIQELPKVPVPDKGLVPLLQVPWIQVYRAFDMGYFPDPAICLWFVVLGNRIFVVHEETWFRTPAPDLAVKICETTKELFGETQVAMTYVDPKIGVVTGDIVTVMDRLEMGGVPCEPSINDREMYCDAIHALLGEEVEPGVPKLQIFEPGCPNLAKYLPKMRWDEKNERKMADHKYDHWPIGLAYFGISSGVLSFTAREDTKGEPAWMGWIREGQSRKRYGAQA